jgi:hypothetical protein
MVLFLIHFSRFSYYHQKDKFSQLLEVLSSEIVTRAKQIIATDISAQTNNVCVVSLSLDLLILFSY